MTELTARLRKDSWVNASNRAERVRNMCHEAATEIDRLNGEAERLEADRDDWKETAEETRDTYQTETREWRNQLVGLKAKGDALAEAVQAVVAVYGGVANARAFDKMQAALTAFRGGDDG